MEHYHTELVANVTASLLPALSPPPGVVPDFFHRTNRLWAFNVVAQTACMVVAGALFFLRCYVRLGFSRMPRQWILEDCTYPIDHFRSTDIQVLNLFQGWCAFHLCVTFISEERIDEG